MDGLKEEKKRARAVLRQRRREAFEQSGGQAPERVRDIFMANVFCEQGLLIASYIPYKEEMDPTPLMRALQRKGHRFCLPCAVGGSLPLVFRAYRLGDALRLGKKDIPEPSTNAPVVYPDMMLMPLVGFDRLGHRLGQGGGYYDRTVQQHRGLKKIMAVGVAYAAQESPSIPFDEADALLDAVITEKEYIDISKTRL